MEAVEIRGSVLCSKARKSDAWALRPMALVVVAAAVFSIAQVSAPGQAVNEPTATQGVTQSIAPDSRTTTANGLTGEEASDSGPESQRSSVLPQTLSSAQILDILQQNPDLVIELKTLVADRLQMDANDISDEALYEQIGTNANLRANITVFLRARGYVGEDDLQDLNGFGQTGTESGPVGQSVPILANTMGEQPPGAEAGASNDMRMLRLDEYGQPEPLIPPMSSARRNTKERRSDEATNASTDLPKVLRQPTPYNLQSMRDLYTQIPTDAGKLKRFGSEVFVERDMFAATRGLSGRDTPLDVPLGPDYVVGSGDTLTIAMWGGVTQSMNRIVDRDGRILLPEAGSVEIAGLPLGRAQSVIEGALKPQYRNVEIAVTVSRVRSVRVYVVGDVQRPGGYDISPLATPVSALYAAGGPTSVGSLRTLRHYRGTQLVEDVDLYDFLLHGIHSGSARFESGDTLLVPPAGPQIAVYGAVKRPAIYEMKAGETGLTKAIEDAGGFTAAASPGHINIERIDASRQRETVTLNIADDNAAADRNAMAAFEVRDGDRIRVDPILAYSERVIYIEGHVARPGRFAYTDGMTLSDVLRSYHDMLPEPAAHGEIVRLAAPDLHAETIAFDVPDVLIGNDNVNLQPFDTIRVFGRYEADAPKVTIRGEVLRPGTYPMSVGMTAAQLVRAAGGFKRDALQDDADLTSYDVKNGSRIFERVVSVRIGAAVAGANPNADVLLKPGDTLSIHQITGWNDIGESIRIEGEVRFPGSYGFQDGERLSSVLRRAGGFLPAAYPAGAVLERVEVRDLEQKSREELIRQIETNAASARLSPNLGSGDSGAALQLIRAQQDEVLSNLKNHPPTGRMVIHINADIDSWANSPADIELRRGDVLTIPKRPGFVLVTGQVYNATALTFTPGKTAGWYLSRAGGTNSTANRKEIFIIRANGSVIGRRSGGLFDESVLSARLNPGDVVVVPQKILGNSLLWRNLLTTAQLASSIAITASVAAL